jgi:hypothetical protein
MPWGAPAVNDEDENPVASGLIALVAVAVVVGLLAGIGALAGTRLLGIGDNGGSSVGDPNGGRSLYLPDPIRTRDSGGPLVTLIPSETATTTAPNDYYTETPVETETAQESAISLTVGSTSVEDNEELMLSGTYVGGEGAVLDILYNVNRTGWEEFPLDTNVSGGIFQTYVQTYKTGVIQWRVKDSSTGKVSNVVSVRHGG